MCTRFRLAGLCAALLLALWATTAVADTLYVVKPGDTLFRIAQVHQTSVAALATANNLVNPHLIYAGTTLRIPGQEAATPPLPTVSYLVQPGDTLLRIALAHGVSVYALAQLNQIPNINLIYVGQPLHIPISAAEPSEAAPVALGDGVALLYTVNGQRQLVYYPVTQHTVVNDFGLFVDDWNDIRVMASDTVSVPLTGAERVLLAVVGQETPQVYYDPALWALPGDAEVVGWYDYVVHVAPAPVAASPPVQAHGLPPLALESVATWQPQASQPFSQDAAGDLGFHLKELATAAGAGRFDYQRLLLAENTNGGLKVTLVIFNQEAGSPDPFDRIRLWCLGPPPRPYYFCRWYR